MVFPTCSCCPPLCDAVDGARLTVSVVDDIGVEFHAVRLQQMRLYFGRPQFGVRAFVRA